MSLLSSRRRPWPYHARLGSILGPSSDRFGVMLIPSDQTGLMVARKQQMLDGVVPSDQEYGSAPVYRERTSVLRPTAGYGERVQSSFGDRRYYWGKNIQISGGLLGKGPLIHAVVPTTAAGGQVTKFIDAPNAAGATQQFILSGAIVYRRTDDTGAGQVVDRNGVSNAPLDAVVFQGGFSGAAASLYVAWSDGSLWERTPAAVWTQCALPSGFSTMRLEVVGTELWAADTVRSVVRKVTADPKVAGNWSGPYLIGDPSTKISALRQVSNQLCIFKEDGSVFTLNSDGSANDLFPTLASYPSVDNGLRAVAWMNSIWFKVGPSSYLLAMPGASLTPIGPGRLVENASPVRGDSCAFAGWGGYRAYSTIYNSDTNVSYLLSYGNWETKDSDEGRGQQVVLDDQWDGSMAEWPNRIATAMGVSGASGQERMYIGFNDGKWDWFKLVRSPFASVGPPLARDGIVEELAVIPEYTTDESYIVFPLHTAMFSADLKHTLGFSLFGPWMAPGDEVQLFYRLMASGGGPPLNPTASWIELGEFTANGQRIPAPANLVSHGLSLKMQLFNTNSADTPIIEIVAIHERVVPAFKRDLQMTVDARGFVTRLDGAIVRADADRIHRALLDFAAAPGSLAIELPDETINEVAFFGYQERLLPMQAGGGRGWGVEIQATQFRILTVYGIIRRLRGTRIGDLRGYKISALRTL